jgi:hypothetical protein
MPGLVPGIHVLAAANVEGLGWPGRSPAMTTERELIVRHARPCAGHPRSLLQLTKKGVDGRDVQREDALRAFGPAMTNIAM